MYTILKKRKLSDVTNEMVLDAPHVARRARSGQFVIVRIDERSERIPLTIADYDRSAGTITILFQEVGKSTMQLGTLQEGDHLLTCAGPLGNPTRVDHYGTVVCVGGGVGVAPIFPIARDLKEAGNTIISIIGARTRQLLIWEDRMRTVSDELIVCTDDGSYGRKALVTEPLKEVLEQRHVDRVWAVGPAIMMKFVALTTKPHNIPTVVSLNPIMVDGTGMCGCCRVLIGGQVRFVCVEGPQFDAHEVDWENLLMRMQYYKDEERLAVEHWKEHRCRLEQAEQEAEKERHRHG
jgi:ferredoxin--NADP+ reductase